MSFCSSLVGVAITRLRHQDIHVMIWSSLQRQHCEKEYQCRRGKSTAWVLTSESILSGAAYTRHDEVDEALLDLPEIKGHCRAVYRYICMGKDVTVEQWNRVQRHGSSTASTCIC